MWKGRIMREGPNGSTETEEQVQLLSLATRFQEREEEEGECEMTSKDADKLNDELKELKSDFKEHKESLGTLIVQITKIEVGITSLTKSLDGHLCHCLEFRKERAEFEGDIEKQIITCPESSNIEKLKEASDQIKGSLKFWGIILSLLCTIVTIASVMTTAIYKSSKAESKQEK